MTSRAVSRKLKIMANRIKKIRDQLGITQALLAKIIGVSASQVSQYESGIKQPSPKTAMKFAYYCKGHGINVGMDHFYP